MTAGKSKMHAVRWSAVDVAARHGLTFLVVLVLARLVDPEDFGIIALLQFFLGFATVLVDGGFGLALTQRQGNTTEDETSVFYFNMFSGAVVSGILILAAPFIAGFFDRPLLEQLAVAMACNLFIASLGSIHVTLLTKALDFRVLAMVGFVSSTVSGGLGIYLAWDGFGVWSLVWQTVSASVVSVTLLWVWNPWRPVGRVSFRSLQTLNRFGGYMLLSGLLDATYNRLYSVLIGRLFSALDLGYFWRALTTRQMVLDGFEAVMNRVALPVLSSLHAEGVQLAESARKMLAAMMFVNVPVMLGLAVIAEPLVVTLFGEKWLHSAPILKVLCLAGAIWPLHTVNLNALMALGRSELFFRIEVLKKTIGLIALIAASLHSVMAIAWVQVVVGVGAFFINAHYSGALLVYGAYKQIKDVIPFFLAAIGMALVILLTRFALDVRPLFEVAISIGVGIFVYPILLWVIRRDVCIAHLTLVFKMIGFSKC
jgi:teichuronic acid exporter